VRLTSLGQNVDGTESVDTTAYPPAISKQVQNRPISLDGYVGHNIQHPI